MRVFVAGGTGAIGGHAIPALLEAGHEVTALARTPDKAAALKAQGARPVKASLFDREALTPVLAGHDAVVNLATAIPSMDRFMNAEALRTAYRVRSEGSAALADAALAAGVGRMVQESVSMVYHDQGAAWIDEGSPVDDYPMTRGNFAAEASARRFARTGGGAGVVLRFGWFYGPGAAHSEQLFAMARHHVGMVLGRPGGYVSSIHMADAGSAVAAALEAPAGTYNVVDDEPLTKRAYSFALSQAAGATAWVRGPGRAAYLFGDRLTSLTRSLRVANGRFRAAAGWAPRHRSAREGWLATARVLGR
ncbi:NAD(P)-dependent oxidoreductase [Nonomuraea sp. NPDC050643]|uniref:NAD-dependent epimerase/dehydratase family protein n=1 Tax=Nonomuraea sp. NPDC050643 TaxID=3155660 RepID=UPI0033F01A61